MAPTWGWRDGVAGALGFAPREPYTFCPTQEFFSPAVGAHVVGGDAAGVVAVHSRPFAPRPAVPPARVTARPTVQPKARGPSPESLGIEVAQVPRPARSDPALARARQFARPSTAMPLGAHPAMAHVVRATMAPRPVMMWRPAFRAAPTKRK
jgi:hypothetical protein